ncbi:nucleoside kinase [Tepidibacter thalassicus]|uniref:Uridine kinase n=1 Tax=Tepidibacter thalassicus DSM 15285 TaxID=1123350 RepID=A0A1M5RPV3_9FIRM|nr:nucleoside kinase [Tepidibacter thalassicus]SHH28367.1 uridine kinase [Tepidibacter thalassicus DSM 15285]
MSKVKVKIMNEEREYNVGTKLIDISREYQKFYKSPIVLGVIDNQLRELNYQLEKDCNLEFIDLSCEDGIRTYMRSLSFVFIRACEEMLSGCKVTVEHSLGKGLYCEIHYDRPINEVDVEKIQSRMREIIEEDVPFEKKKLPIEEAIKIFESCEKDAKVNLFKYKESKIVSIYKCGWIKNYFYGYMVPSTGYLKLFDLKYYKPGVVILGPKKEHPNEISKFEPQPKLAGIYKEAEEWAKIMKVDKVASLNDLIERGEYPSLIRTVEALHEKKISQIADMIVQNKEKGRLILIAGPSSSGKTSFAQRLSIQLRVNKLSPVSISLDDYFVNREDTPKDEDGNYDFESIYAIDLELFNEHLEKLILGYEIEIPFFNFKTGKREYIGKKLKVTEEQPIIIEGIHGLNDLLTKSIPDGNKFKIYVSALTQLNLDEHNRIPTTDLRLIRRIVRDHQFRGHSAVKTIQMWPLVRRGEERNIFPYQEEADVMFNSACVYELAVLKKYAEPLLKEIDKNVKEYREAKRLLKFLQYFVPIKEEIDIPPTSILREFIGGSRLLH